MTSSREDLLAKWVDIESKINLPLGSIDYQREWGALRERFYDENGSMPISELDKSRLRHIKNKFLGERIFILGNGPSLNSTPLDLLQDEFTFVTNRAYLLLDRVSWRPTFYTALDWRVVPDVANEINLLSGVVCFFEERFKNILRSDEDVFWYTHTPAADEEEKIFAYNIENGLRGAGSVIGACIQIAFFLGFREIYLIGCDLGYKVIDSVVQEGEDRFGNGVKLHLTSTEDNDPNHFDPRYFGKGRRWHDPNVKRMVSGHEQCLKGITSAGGVICNATVGGELEVYPRIDFVSLFPAKKANNVVIRRQELLGYFRLGTKRIAKDRKSLLGPCLRSERVHFDETDAVWGMIRGEPGLMVDVGAHRGTSCLPFLASGWKVHAFEPDDVNRTALLAAVEKGGYHDRFIIDTRAVGEVPRLDIPYYKSEVSSGISGLSAFHESHMEAKRVDITSLSEALKFDEISNIKFLKIDTEGHDLFVLKGFPWDKGRPAIIECEFEDAKTLPLGYSFHDLAGFLLERGYRVFVSEWHPIIRYGIKHDWCQLMEYPAQLENENGWGNLIAFRDSVDEQMLIDSISKFLSDRIAKPFIERSRATAERRGEMGRLDIVCANKTRKVSSNKWYVSFPSDGKAVFWLNTLRTLRGSVPGARFVGGMKISSSADIEVSVSLARHGKTKYEGIAQHIRLRQGQAIDVSLDKTFSEDHDALKVQIEGVNGSAGQAAVLMIEGFYIFEHPQSVLSRRRSEELTVTSANLRFRDRDYYEAFVTYAALSIKYPINMYRESALFTARKLGFPLTVVSNALSR